MADGARRLLPVLAMAALVAAAGQARAGNSIVGTWVPTADGYGPTFEFAAGGVVIFNDRIGTYWVAGNNLTIDANGKQLTFRFRVIGDELTLTSSDGQETTLQRQKKRGKDREELPTPPEPRPPEKK